LLLAVAVVVVVVLLTRRHRHPTPPVPPMGGPGGHAPPPPGPGGHAPRLLDRAATVFRPRARHRRSESPSGDERVRAQGARREAGALGFGGRVRPPGRRCSPSPTPRL